MLLKELWESGLVKDNMNPVLIIRYPDGEVARKDWCSGTMEQYGKCVLEHISWTHGERFIIWTMEMSESSGDEADRERYFTCPECDTLICKLEDLEKYRWKYCGHCGGYVADARNEVLKRLGKIVKKEEKEVILDEVADLVGFPSEEDKKVFEGIKDKFCYSTYQDPETGWLKISPMNEENCITIHGADEAELFINCLMDHFR